MTGSALFWLGITAACVAGLGISLVQLRKQRIERDALQREVATQRTAASLATERAEAAEAERTQLLEDCSTLKAQLSAQTATLAERGMHHESQMKWVEESRAALRTELEVIGQKLLASSGRHWRQRIRKALIACLSRSPKRLISFKRE